MRHSFSTSSHASIEESADCDACGDMREGEGLRPENRHDLGKGSTKY